MYECIPNGTDGSGNPLYYQAQYNKKGLVKEETVTACEFDPPKISGVFRVALYGAGAGGHSYYSVRSTSRDVPGEYKMGGSIPHDEYDDLYVITDDDIGRFFAGERVELPSVSVPGSCKGGDVKLSYVPQIHSARYVKCIKYGSPTKDYPGSIYDVGIWSPGYSRLVGRKDQNTMDEVCAAEYGEGYRFDIDNSYSSYYGHGVDIDGGSAGDPLYFGIAYTIPNTLPSGETSWEQWFKDIVALDRKDSHNFENGYYACEDGDDVDKYGNSAWEDDWTAGDGWDYGYGGSAKVNSYFGYIEFKPGVNGDFATSGTGAWYEGGDVISWGNGKEGEPPKWKSGRPEIVDTIGYGNLEYIEGSRSESRPQADLMYKEYYHEYTLGQAGGSAIKPTVYNKKHLPSPCHFEISHGGQVYAGSGELPEPADTKIVCGTGDDMHERSAPSGKVNIDPVKTTNPSPSTSYPDPVKVVSKDVWFNFAISKNRPNVDIGTGGYGSTITDNCTGFFGEYLFELIRNDDRKNPKENGETDKYIECNKYSNNGMPSCPEMASCLDPDYASNSTLGDWVGHGATAGGPGAVMIMW